MSKEIYRHMLKKGLIEVYTSQSPVTNFAPMGLCLRASGHRLRTHMTSFLPHEWMDGSPLASILLKPYLTMEHTGIERIPPRGAWRSWETEQVCQAFQKAREALLGCEYDLVVLNEINPVCRMGIIPHEAILELMDLKPAGVELVLSGAGASEDVIERADLVTEMVCHVPKDKGREDKFRFKGAPVEVVTGNGKGKTTYCLGKALLMSCLGARTTILQFIKSPKPYGEVMAIERLPYLDIKTLGEGFLLDVPSGSRKGKHLEAARRAWEEGLREIFSLKYGLIVLDEINIATYYGLVHAERVREMLFLKPEKLHLILSGRNAHQEVTKGATCVIEMREIKHPFGKGVKARKGIEF